MFNKYVEAKKEENEKIRNNRKQGALKRNSTRERKRSKH
jgi:hypothetical protein